MIGLNSQIINHCRTVVISAFVILHFCALVAWIAPPYAAMMDSTLDANSATRRFEHMLFAALRPKNGEVVSNLLRKYIDFLGVYQYWDFFAPTAPRIHRYLSVCGEILMSSENRHIKCLDPLYQSFDGNLNKTAESHRGERSRSFRLVENLVRLDRPDLMDAFTMYWRNKQHRDQTKRTFLLLHEYTLYPGSPNVEREILRRDELIWVSSE